MRAPALLAVVLAACAILVACSGSGSGDNGEPVRPFEEVRSDLLDRLDTIGVNIASVPPDVRQQVVEFCRELEPHIGDDRTDEICGALQDAFDRADPGRIDRVVAELLALED
jgi:hypothetical protein